MTDKEKEPCKGMTQNQVERYVAEKRLQILLNKKFEMLEKLHPFLLGEHQETTETYVKLFDCIDEAIVQESKVVVKNENATHKRQLDEQRLDEIAKKIFIGLQNCASSHTSSELESQLLQKRPEQVSECLNKDHQAH